METTFGKGSVGWSAKTTLDLPDARQLVIRTERRVFGGGLATNGTVFTINGDGTTTHVMGLGVAGFGDYSERLMLTQPARITEKAVRQQHEQVLARIDAIRDQALAYYQTQRPESALV